ncbi:MAG: hypothetical protein PVI21_00700 [Candidatus Woesebacteria bacterium]
MHWRESRITNPRGREVLNNNPELAGAVERFLSSPKPEEAIGGQSLGSGTYSSARRFGNFLVKVSSATTNKKAHRKSQAGSEDLFRQFKFLSELYDYLQIKSITTIVTPRQYFAYRSRCGAYLLCQQYMDGWITLKEWAESRYSPNVEEDVTFVSGYCEYVRWRVMDFAQNAGFERDLNDLKLKDGKLHARNILVPQGCDSSPSMPLCIIDQPCTSARAPRIWVDMLTWFMGCANLNFVPNKGHQT